MSVFCYNILIYCRLFVILFDKHQKYRYNTFHICFVCYAHRYFIGDAYCFYQRFYNVKVVMNEY